MDAGISSGVSSMLTQQKVGDAVGIQVTRKAMDIEASNAMALVNGASEAAPNKRATEGNLGRNIDVTA